MIYRNIPALKSGPKFLATGLTLILAIASCTTTDTEVAKDKEPVSLPKVGEKAPEGPGIQIPLAPPGPSTEELTAFLARCGADGAPFSEADRELVSRIPSNPPPGSVAEAALTLGIIKTVSNPLTGATATFEEADLGGAAPPPAAPVPTPPAVVAAVPTPGLPPPPEQAPAAGVPLANAGQAPAVAAKGPSLEQLSADRGVDFAAALERNPLLQTIVVNQMVSNALAQGTNSELFSASVKAVIAKQVSAWRALADKYGYAAPQTPIPLVVTPPDANQQAITPPPPAIEAAPPSPSDLRSGDVLLAEAQALADRGEFDAAIGKVAHIPPSSPMYATAQERLKMISNKAVQDLRRKAAQAFQVAAPITDPKSRAAYLEQARGYLENALNKYPAADQLATVRDNLAVISRDLARLSQDKTEGDSKAASEGTTAPPKR